MEIGSFNQKTCPLTSALRQDSPYGGEELAARPSHADQLKLAGSGPTKTRDLAPEKA